MLDQVDLSSSVSREDHARLAPPLYERLRLAQYALKDARIPTVIVFEGWDAAGKGLAISRLLKRIDPRGFQVYPARPPTEDEQLRPFLYRFWVRLPARGEMALFDRSWYGRVLVERVEGFAREEQWRRAYLEINDFEEQLASHGTLLLKFWLHVSPQEQLRRFKDRQRTAYKQHKITDEDWRNRKQWPAYAAAVNEMVVRTSTPDAPWTLVAGDDKRAARLTILETLVERLERAL